MARYRSTRRTGIAVSAVLAAVLFLIAPDTPKLRGTSELVSSKQPGLYTISQFIDGDTIVIDMDGTPERIRLIGVDTPETHDPRKAVQCYGWAAAAFTKTMLAGSRVRLQADPGSTNRDRYGRLLRYVYLPDGTQLNTALIRGGYALAYTYFPFSRAEEFKVQQQIAQQEHKGLWGNCTLETDSNGQVHSSPAI